MIFQEDKIVKLVNIIREDIKNTAFMGKVYIVGGAVRDALLGKPVDDIDIVVELSGGGISLASYLCAKHRCFTPQKNPLIFQTYGVASFCLSSEKEVADIEIQCVQTRKEKYDRQSRNPSTVFGSLKEDARRRDLTINALYYDISNDRVIDPNGMGIDDLNKKIIRTPTSPDIIFDDDPLRIMRVIRFATKLGWGIEKNTWFGIVKNVYRLPIVSQERISDELTKILLCKKPSLGVERLWRCGALEIIIPDIYSLTQVYESKIVTKREGLFKTKTEKTIYSKVTVFEHTMNVIDKVQPILSHRLAALFHDVAKIIKYDKDKTDEVNDFSSEVALADLKALKYPNKVINEATNAIRLHGRFDRYSANVPKDKHLRRFVDDCGEDLAIVVNLMHANDVCDPFNPKPNRVLDILKRIEQLIDEDANDFELPITGDDIITKFNIKGGPLVGKALSKVKDACYDNPRLTKEEAFEIAKLVFAT